MWDRRLAGLLVWWDRRLAGLLGVGPASRRSDGGNALLLEPFVSNLPRPSWGQAENIIRIHLLRKARAD